MKYFTFCQTLEHVKRLYRELCFKHHPDKGGDVRIMQEINAEYAKALRKVWFNDANNTAGKTAEETAEDFATAEEEEAIFRAKIDALIALEGLEIEICGRWIWITGNTREHKDAIKAQGFYWSGKKLAWYWRPEDAKVKGRRRGSKTLEEIRDKYGSQKYAHVRRPAIA